MAESESRFQSKLKKDIKDRFPGCIVTKNESYIQGFPDLTIYYNELWATLECKRSPNAKKQPNQDYYVSRMNKMGFSRFICPGNKDDVLNELEEYFEGRRTNCDI